MRSLYLNDLLLISGGTTPIFSDIFLAGMKGDDVSPFFRNALIGGTIFGGIFVGAMGACLGLYAGMPIVGAIAGVAVGAPLGGFISYDAVCYEYRLGANYAQAMQLVNP
jgi:hypothetical protein